MIRYFPIKLLFCTSDYVALHDFCQGFADYVLGHEDQLDQVRNAHLVLAHFYTKQFTYARNQLWTGVTRRRSGKRYPFTMGLLYARLLHTYMQECAISPAQQLVLGQLNQALTNAGDVLTPGGLESRQLVPVRRHRLTE
ncbi:hypothetical protein [Fibrella aquatilis]|uniref:Uncharacterized protein n=1 Tax=Fibrella aquatilis TaxID=2817059 RepID=A0A939G1W6_9BACT|nr:hypothetical protein [Fibrella aquatilis]MBO0930346.1 hypothetical protein [Fibrella aquatilis]